jgi:guanylate kinase
MPLAESFDVGAIAICGPTCSGKSTLVQALAARWPSMFAPIVTTTTRLPRPGEVPGRDYHFVSRDQFEQYAAHGELVESDEFSGHWYGIRRDELRRLADSGRVGVAALTPNGIDPIRTACAVLGRRLVTVYVAATRQELTARLLQRYRADREARAAHYARRLLHLLDSQNTWQSAYPYEIVEPDFNARTLESVVQQIHVAAAPRSMASHHD